ncbi:MAG: HAMP domain-containing protein, partial [Burkholderiaceae bacterium]|nr:HAMP domain-containing protein [Burkholderiaceae bacterium]
MLHTIRARLIVICIGITLASLLLLSAATFFTVRKDTLASVDTRIDQLTQLYAEQLSGWVRDKQRITSSIRAAATQADPAPLIQAAKEAGDFDDAYLVYADNRATFLHAMPEGYVGTGRPWYQQAMQANGPILVPAYTDASTGELTISFAEPFGPSGQRLGVVGTDMRLTSMAKTVASIRPMSRSFAFLVNAKGLLIAHPQAELTLKPATHISADLGPAQMQALAQMHQGMPVDIGGVPHLVYAHPVAGTPWTLTIAIDRAEALQPVRTLLQVTAGITVLCALLAAALLLLSLTQQLRRIDTVRRALQDIASGDGDLTRRLSVQGNDELSHISAAFNQFADKITTVLRQIRGASDAVHVATREIASGNQDLSSRTEQQASSLEETAAAMEELTSTVQQNAESARHASELAHTASQVATQGGSVVDQVVQTMDQIHTSSQRVGDIISVIDG